MKVSCIIPLYNCENIQRLLDSIERNSIKPYEIIIVDDNSSLDYGFHDMNIKFIKIDENYGPSKARNIGAKEARGEVLLFLDSDVEIEDNLLQKIIKFFSDKNTYQVYSSSYSSFIPDDNTFTKYKTAYMKYIHENAPSESNFVLGACTAILKKDFIEWNENYRYAEDTYWGHELFYKYNKKIFFDRNAQVKHHKRYNFFNWLRNDFNIASGMVSSYLIFFPNRNKQSFSHVSHNQILGLILSCLAIITFLLNSKLLALLCLITWFVLSKNLVKSIQQKSELNFILVIILAFINSVTHFAGVSYGFLKFLVSLK
jgi:glycosyltransferase involved in cell wall biosynthesis